VIPALDEERALPLVLGELPPGLFSRVVVVDNGSQDRTAEVARRSGVEVVTETCRGYGRACLTGIERLLAAPASDGSPALLGSDVLAFVDADHSDFPADLEQVLAPVLAGEVQLCIGSRTLGGASWRALLPQAWFGNRLACLFMRILFGARYTDLGPMRAITVEAYQRLGMSDLGFGWTVEMQLKARSFGLDVSEVPVRYRERVGESKITGTLRGTLGAAWKILGWIFAWRLRLWFRRR